MEAVTGMLRSEECFDDAGAAVGPRECLPAFFTVELDEIEAASGFWKKTDMKIKSKNAN